MARYFDVHPNNPQARALRQVVDLLRADGLIVYPTDSYFALGCRLGNKEGIDRIREIRRLDSGHHFTLVCRDFAQLGQFVQVNNALFRSIKAATPGSYTFILPATKEVPRRLLHPKKKTVGVRIPDHVVTQALLPTADGAGRVAALEILLPDDAVRNLIRQAKIEQVYSVMQTNTSRGMQTMEQSLADLITRGVVDLEVGLTRSSRPAQLIGVLERAGFPVGPPEDLSQSHDEQPLGAGLRVAGS